MASTPINGRGRINENEVEVIKNVQQFDHWAFLEEIEAPMWVDLKSCDVTKEEIDDHWFHVSHPFHKCSTRQLVSTVFPRQAADANSSSRILDPSSPKLPPSVSRLRGKIYKTKEWGQSRCNITSNKQHPVKNLNTKSSGTTGSSNKAKPMSKNGKLKENESRKARSSCESDLIDASGSNFSNSTSQALARQEGESSSKSTVTSNHSDHQQTKFLEVPGQTHGLLSSLRIYLRRSHATRPAARVLVKGGRRLEGSSSTSSVGSSLCQDSAGKKSARGGVQNKVKIPESINVIRNSQPPRNKLKVTNGLKVPALNVRNISNKQGNDTCASKVTTKGKVEQKTLHRKALMPRKVNEHNQSLQVEQKTKVLMPCKVGEHNQKLQVEQKTLHGKVLMPRKRTEGAGVGRCAVFPGGTKDIPQNGSKKLSGPQGKGKANGSREIAGRKVPFR